MKPGRSPPRDFCGNLRSTISSCSRSEVFLRGDAKFYEQIRARTLGSEFVFLTGPPKYVSRTWPGEIAEGDTSRGQWNETVKRFLTAA